jgi:hypothetical protein
MTFGEINWEDDSFSDKKANNNKDLWLRLGEGPNELRIITQPYQYLVHKVKKDPSNPKDFGQKVSCSQISGSCPLCDENDKAKPRWLLGVISRKDNTFKILDISYAIFSQIRKLAKNPKKGDPTKYDINIEVDKNGGATGYYSVQSYDKEPLSAADQLIKDSVDLTDLQRRVTPPNAETVQKRIEKIRGETPAADATVAAATTKAPAKATKTVKATKPVSMTADDEEVEKSFPDYDGTPAQ